MMIICFEQVNSESEHLNIFLADLKDENVCSTMYSTQYKDQPNKVCLHAWPYIFLIGILYFFIQRTDLLNNVMMFIWLKNDF